MPRCKLARNWHSIGIQYCYLCMRKLGVRTHGWPALGVLTRVSQSLRGRDPFGTHECHLLACRHGGAPVSACHLRLKRGLRSFLSLSEDAAAWPRKGRGVAQSYSDPDTDPALAPQTSTRYQTLGSTSDRAPAMVWPSLMRRPWVV